jgi:cell division protein FtsQ
METKEKKKRPVKPGNKRPAAAPAKKRSAAPAPGKKRPARGGTDRSRREAAAKAARIKAMKQNVQKAPKRRVSKPKMPMQPIIYTQPKVFNRNRLILQLLSVVAVVLALVLCLSIFFRVKTITVSGADAYSAWAIREASGVEEGDYLLTFSKARACAKIKAELPYVDTVRIGIKLPDTVNIVIEEIDVVYAIQDADGIWWLITSEGKVMEQTDTIGASDYTKVTGVKIAAPEPQKQAVAYQELVSQPEESQETLPEGENQIPAPVLITEQQKLDAALGILRALELNEIVGEAASVDVSDLTRIQLWYGTRYQVNLGDNTNMDYKIACLKYTVSSLAEYDSGELDISFTIWPDKVTYSPFE